MTRVLTIPAAIVMLLLLAVPVSAQDECTDPESDFGEMPFLCGQVGVNIAAESDATIEEILARSAPEAEVINKAEGSESYIVGVPTGDEWANVQALRDDPDVEIASLVGSGTPTVPDTAMEVAAPQTGVAALIALLGVAAIGATSMLVGARQR